MEHYDIELDFEIKHLENTVCIAQKQLEVINQNNKKQQIDIIEAKKELWENTKHSISGLWSMDNFHELAVLGQYTNTVSGSLTMLEAELKKMCVLERIIQTPYFGRIDFRFDDEIDIEKIYIGRSALMDETSNEMIVYDWRSPLASVFYRFGSGKAYYDAPSGRITGEIKLKRQYEIQHGKLDYFFDSDVSIIDEFLRRLLSQNASSKMKTIVETIQKGQDMIIRDMENDLVMVQGVAGSGKTSVALHRVAYMMYKGLSSRLSAHNILIISPNTLFEQHIEGVLPELGEDNAVSVTFDEMLKKIVGDISLQTRNKSLERILLNQDANRCQLERSSLEFKMSSEFILILERFIYDIPRRWIEFSDVVYDGKCVADRNLMKAELLSNKKKIPLVLRLQHLEKSIFEKIHDIRANRLSKLKDFVKNYREHAFEVEEFARHLSILESTALVSKIHKFTKLDTLTLYKQLFYDFDYFKKLAKEIRLPNNIENIFKMTSENLNAKELSYEDSTALAFLQLKLCGFQRDDTIKQVVIDEVQDYNPIHFKLLNILYPQAKYTLLGDIEQTIEKSKNLTFYKQIEEILNKKKTALITMNKSFRCTRDILNFSKRFLEDYTVIESFNRKGDAPKVHQAPDNEVFDELIIKEINTCKEANYQSIGLLCKTEQDAFLLYNRLIGKVGITFINSDSVTDIEGVLILPIYMAKGLEFDAVLLCDTDKTRYFSKDDKKLLYIGCTRALHRLSLFYTEEISPLL